MIPLLQTDLPPSNLSYLLAAFIVTGVVFLGYIFFIFRRKQDTKNEIGLLLGTAEEQAATGNSPSHGESTGKC